MEETVGILESKNLYLQDKNQRIKGVNQGMLANRVDQKDIPSENNPRVLILENDILSTKQKFLEQSMEMKMEALKCDFVKKIEKSEALCNAKLLKQKD